MKKLIFLFALVGFFIAGMQNVKAQWSVTVGWDDTECNCNTITKKSVFITIVYITTQQKIVDNREFDITNETSPYIATGTDTILQDCPDCYYVYARVIYYDPNDCCHGHESGTYDGDDLVDGLTLPTLTLE